MKDAERIGRRLVELRTQRGLTQTDVAVEVGIARTTLTGIETGRAMPGRETLTALATFFGVALESLLHGEPERDCEVINDPAEMKLIRLWRDMTPGMRLAMLEIARAHADTIRPATPGSAALDAVVHGLAEWRRIVPTARGIAVATDCLYFDRTNVTVVVSGGKAGETVVVHDDGGAEDRLAASGRVGQKVDSTLRRVARRFGLLASEGVIRSAPSPISDLSALVGLVAAASQEAAAELLHRSAARGGR